MLERKQNILKSICILFLLAGLLYTSSCEKNTNEEYGILEKELNGVGSNNLPQEVTINPLGKTLITIDIDTGIR